MDDKEFPNGKGRPVPYPLFEEVPGTPYIHIGPLPPNVIDLGSKMCERSIETLVDILRWHLPDPPMFCGECQEPIPEDDLPVSYTEDGSPICYKCYKRP